MNFPLHTNPGLVLLPVVCKMVIQTMREKRPCQHKTTQIQDHAYTRPCIYKTMRLQDYAAKRSVISIDFNGDRLDGLLKSVWFCKPEFDSICFQRCRIGETRGKRIVKNGQLDFGRCFRDEVSGIDYA